jgi:predicted transposase YdaD
MKQKPIPKSKIENPWPRQKRKAAQWVIIWDLKTYKAMKADIEAIERDIDEEAAPSATDIRESIYTQRKQFEPEGGFNTEVVLGKTIHPVGNPTVSKAEAIRRYRESMYAGTEYREMVRRINAIERVLERLEKSQIPDDKLKVRLIKEKFFDQEKSDSQLAKEFNIDVRTLYRWQGKIVREIGKQLGFIT